MSGVLQSIHQIRSKILPQIKGIQEWYSHMMNYRRIGLLKDDLIPEENDLVKEALRRLPEKQQYERLFRMRRALNQDAAQQPLPQEQWTKPSEDIPYLTPYLRQVETEISTKQNFDQLTSIPPALLARNRSS